MVGVVEITAAGYSALALIEATKAVVNVVKNIKGELDDVSAISLPAYSKLIRFNSRVYIDAAVERDPVITDIIKTVHTQYAAFILTALQMNQFVTKDREVQDLLRVVATEDMQPHESVVEGLFEDIKKHVDNAKVSPPVTKETEDDKAEDKKDFPGGKIVAFSGDNHIPAGKILEITLTNPDNPKASVSLNLMVMMSPYIVPELIAVQFVTRDVVPSLTQRYMQWKTGEINFWSDLVFMSDIVRNRAAMLKLDPTGVLADMMGKQSSGRKRALDNIITDKAKRSRNIANSVLIFSEETMQRAKAASGVDVLSSYATRQRYFAMTFAMIIVVVDPLYNHVTFYYNGIEETATFSFDQMRVVNKSNNSLDLVSVMNALNQGKSPKF